MSFRSRKNLADMLQCSVCWEGFKVSGSSKPKMLPCQHSFCVKCIEGIANGRSLECPLCRKVWRQNVEDLPNNLFLLQLIDSRAIGDRISAIQQHYQEPTKVFPQLKVFQEAQTTSTFQSDHILVIMQCLEHYVHSKPLRQPGIVVVCMDILGGMAKYAASMSVGVRERLHSNTLHALMVLTIRSSIQVSCINILRNLADLECQKNYTSANAKVMFGYLDEQLQAEDEIKLAFILRSFIGSMKNVEKDDIGTRENVKILIKLMKHNWSLDEYLLVLLDTLAGMTDSAATPCSSFVQEDGLELLQRILKEDRRDVSCVVKYAMTILNNICETPRLRKDVIKENTLLKAVVDQLKSKDVAIRAMASRAISQLSLFQPSSWLQACGRSDTRKALLTKLHKHVLLWIKKDTDAVEFDANSFKSLFVILQAYNTPPSQLYAAWWLRKYCREHGTECQELLINDDAMSILIDIKENHYADKTLRKVVGDILTDIGQN